MSSLWFCGYRDKAAANNFGAPFRLADIALEKMVEIAVAKQGGDFVGDELPDVTIGCQNLFDNLRPPVDDEKDILQIAASEQVALTPAEIGFQLCGQE